MGRIIAQVVSGDWLPWGWDNNSIATVRVTGITTAALLWLISALGLIVGIGGTANYVIAAVTVVLVLPLSYFSRKLGEKLAKNVSFIAFRLFLMKTSRESSSKILQDKVSLFGKHT